MARWSRSRLRTFGIGAVVVLGGALFAIPAVSQAEDEPSRPGAASVRAAATPPDRLTMVPGKKRSAFTFQPGSGDRDAPYAFVSTGGDVRVRQLGGGDRPIAQARTGAPRQAAAVTAAATTYKTTLTVASENWSAWNKSISVWNRSGWTYLPVTNQPNSLSATINLAPGNYYVAVMYGIYDVNSYLLTKAFTVTDRAQTIKIEEKSAKEVALKADDTTAVPDASAVWMSLPNGDLVGFAGGYKIKTYVTTASTAGTTLRVHEVLIKAGSSALKPSPYRYDLVKSWAHPLPASFVTTVKTSSLAKTTTTVRAQGITTDATYWTAPMMGEWTSASLATSLRAPATFTDYVTPGVTISRVVSYGDSQSLMPKDRSLPVGTTPGETVGAGPLSPSRRPWNDDSNRYGSRLQITENMTLGDAAGNLGADSAVANELTLSSGGQVLKTSKTVSLSAEVPAAEQTYQLEQTTTRKVAWSQLSTKTSSEWTFSSGSGYRVLPLMDLAVGASGLDQRNRAGSSPVRLTVTPSTRQTEAAGNVDTVEWSADDGATWTELPVTTTDGKAEATLTIPSTVAFVSLRLTASNADGGSLRRTVLRALAGPATPGDETAGGTKITNLKINGGKALVAATSGTVEFTASFTASDPSGIAGAGLYLYHGSYNTPDGLQLSRTECQQASTTTSNCTAYMNVWDVRYSLNSNALAGAWKAEVWATAKDGKGFVDRRAAGTLGVKRHTKLTMDATPEPVKKGKTVTAWGTLTRADWSTWSYKPYAAQTVNLQWLKLHTSAWGTVKTAKTDTNGKLKPTVTAGSAGFYRLTWPGDTISNTITSGADYIDVR
ncbi:MAG: hypothetical protein ABW000_05915 [Actinoplanes sp.]